MSNKAKATISLNAKPFEDGAKAAVRAAEKMSSGISSAMSTALGVIGGGIALKGLDKLASTIGDLTTGGIGLAVEMADLAATTGMAADEAVKYNFALKNGLTSGAAEKLMGSAAKNIGKTAEVFRGIKIRMEAVYLNLQGVFTRIAAFFAPVIDQILAMAENVDWDAWAKSAEAFLKPVKNGIMALIQLATEGRIWEVAGKVMQLGFAKAGNALNHGLEVAKNTLPAIGDILKASLLTVINTVVHIGKVMGNVLGAVFSDSGRLLGISLVTGIVNMSAKLISMLINIFRAPIVVVKAGLQKAVETLIENIPDFLLPENMEDFKAQSFADIFNETDDNSKDWSKPFDDIAKESGEAFTKAFGELADKVGKAARETEFSDVAGAGDSVSAAMDKFKKAVTDTKFIDKFGAGEKTEELGKIIKDALDRVNTKKAPDTTNIKGRAPIFGKADSLASVGGGGGVATGLMGVLGEAKRQTNLQEKMVSLLSGGTVQGASEPRGLRFGF